MSATARHHMRFLLAVAVATTVASSAAEARHWRYYWLSPRFLPGEG